MNNLFQITLLVRDYQEAIDFYVHKLGCKLVEDTELGSGKRWVRVAFQEGMSLLLAKASTPEQATQIGNQTGGRVFLFVQTNNFESYHKTLSENGVRIVDGPRSEPYGKVLVFEDLYGNKFDLIQPPENEDKRQ